MKGNNLYLSFGTEIIYDDANFSLDRNDKVGIVGVNGAGKTTLFKVLLNIQELDSGKIEIPNDMIGYLPQEIIFPNKEMTVYEYLYSARPIQKLQEELTKIYEELTICNEKKYNFLLKKAGKLQDKLDRLDEYNAETDLLELIDDMKIPLEMLDQKVSELSGGQKSKIAFAHLLFSKSDIFLLDEPTNHLDVSTKEYITNYLKNYNGMILIISHDIDFLNSIINKTMFINKVNHKINIYNGNYSDFKKTYAREQMLKEMRIKEQEREIKKLEEFVKMADDASATNHNLKRLGKSRKILLEKKKSELETRDKTYKKVKMRVEPLKESGKVPIQVNNLCFNYPNKPNLYTNLSFDLVKKDKFLIVGENGIGKSTLLKLIMGLQKPTGGDIKFGANVQIAYYAQELEILDEDKTIFQNVQNINWAEVNIRSFLGNFLFIGDDVYKKVSVLSPGEKARVALCKVLMEKSNVIILDEPTNHFDPDTQNIIGENFKDYTGTLLIVSHNPEFVKTLGITKMLVLPEGRIMDYSEELLSYYYYLNTELI